MGCGVSKKVETTFEEKDLRMYSCKLIFTQRQLLHLNKRFLNLLDHRISLGMARERQSAHLGVVVERLVQKLVCSIGNLDARFSSKFLVNLEPFKNYNSETRRSIKYKYLIRLDLISSPALYPEFFDPPVRIIEGLDNESQPQGYARIKVHGEFLEQWVGFISPSGFLRRDKIQERFVELLARAVANPTPPKSPEEVDESRLCGSPGKILDPVTLHHVLKMPPSRQFFFGPPECNESRFPDPRDFRIAIVEGVPETKLHISFLSPAAQITGSEEFEVSLVLGVGVCGWPSASDFPSRLPFDHVDVMLAYEAAQMDYYLVPQGPHSSLYCEDKLSLWEIRVFATEMFFQHHYSSTSTIFKVYKILLYLREILNGRGVKIITSYVLKTLLLFELEYKKHIQNWAPEMLARRVLSILDRLLNCLRRQHIPSYFFTDRNLFLHDNVIEEDFFSDGDVLEHYLKLLHNDGCKIDTDEGKSIQFKDQLENVMLQKWSVVIENLTPPMSNRSRRLGVVNNSPTSIIYTRQQLEYISLLLQGVLKVKNLQKKNKPREMEEEKFEKELEEAKKNKEDFIYLLQLMFDQAKKISSLSLSRSRLSKAKINKLLKLDEILLSYDISTSLLVDDIRRKNCDFSFADDVSVVTKILEYLYQAIDSDSKILGQILRPYLNQLFKGSHENCWFLQEWKKRTDLSEMNVIGIFSSLVISGQISPLEGIMDAASKGWTWAKISLQILQKISEEASTRIITGEKIDLNETGLKLIFIPEPKTTIRFNLKASKGKKLGYEKKIGNDSRCATIRSYQEILDSAITAVETEKKIISQSDGLRNVRSLSEKVPHHLLLKEGNPLTVASLEARRKGNHRGLGRIIQALISLKKLTVIQEISQYLPENEKIHVLNDISKLSKEIQRLTVENFRKKKLINGNTKNRFSFKKSSKVVALQQQTCRRIGEEQFSEVYRTIDQFPRLEIPLPAESKLEENLIDKKQENTLLKTCRKTRRQNRFSSFDLNTFQSVSIFSKCEVGNTVSKSLNNTSYTSNH